MEPAVLERARALEHVRYAAAAEDAPALLEAAAARLREKRRLDAGQQLWLALLGHGRDRLLLTLIGAFRESPLVRASCPLPELVGRIDDAELAALLDKASTDHARDVAGLAEQARRQAAAGPVIATYLGVVASSLGEAAFPVEVSWAALHAGGVIDSGSYLVAPATGWTDWSTEVEARHQVPRVMVEALGRPATEVAAELDERFGGGVVYANAPDRAVRWIDWLYTATGNRRRWRIGDARGPGQSLVVTEQEREVWARWRSIPRCHSAGVDAYQLAVTHRGLRELAVRRR